MAGPMKIVFLQWIIGLPTLEHLADVHDVQLVGHSPTDRPVEVGRSRQRRWGPGEDPDPCFKVMDINRPDSIERLRSIQADAWVIIAFGQKLGAELLAGRFAMNLHASLLPRHRGAAPIHHAILSGDRTTGLSVITIADRIDAGDVMGSCVTEIHPRETTGELHDRLAEMGPAVIEQVLQDHASGSLQLLEQDESLVTMASKLSKSMATVRFDQASTMVRNGVHGLLPWPGCTIQIGPHRVRLLRLEAIEHDAPVRAPGSITPDGIVSCDPGHVRLLEVQSPGNRPMPFQQWLHGHPIDSDTIRPLESAMELRDTLGSAGTSHGQQSSRKAARDTCRQATSICSDAGEV